MRSWRQEMPLATFLTALEKPLKKSRKNFALPGRPRRLAKFGTTKRRSGSFISSTKNGRNWKPKKSNSRQKEAAVPLVKMVPKNVLSRIESITTCLESARMLRLPKSKRATTKRPELCIPTKTQMILRQRQSSNNSDMPTMFSAMISSEQRTIKMENRPQRQKRRTPQKWMPWFFLMSCLEVHLWNHTSVNSGWHKLLIAC
mmetsp:Transcript_7302/g.12713  ORF Transcript_7302/g.12713 Transcript_7302/m.12713 type:complete len:201 (-) Transcript_7302:714-1316(-)